MQETKYGIKLVQEDLRWMFGEADLGNALAPFSTRAVAPVSLEAASHPQFTLGSTLATLSVDINALTQEQVRLRETLETLNSTLFINSNSLAPREAGVTAGALKNEPKAPPADPSADAGKSALDTLWDSAKSKAADKLIDLAIDKIGKMIKGRKKIGGRGSPLRRVSERTGNWVGGSQMGFHSGAPLQGLQSFVGAVPSSSNIPAGGLTGVLAKLESTGVRRLGPLKYASVATDVIQGIRNGDAKAVGSGLSTAGGAWAGASAGAAIGTMVFPGVGTAVGGAIGGLLGSEAGAWLGNQLFGSSDRLPTPNAVSKELNSARTDNVQVTLAPSIQITGVNPADAQQVVNQVIQALQFQCLPMLTDTLGIRRNAALADPPGGD